jgi:SAM-dependent methyltransferase
MTPSVQPAESQTAIQDDPWGARVRDWAEVEDENSRELFETVHDATGVDSGVRLLDVVCGSGLACAMAAARGAEVSGMDASPGMVALAQERLPQAELRVGDMASLPYTGTAARRLPALTSPDAAISAQDAASRPCLRRIAENRVLLPLHRCGSDAGNDGAAADAC